MIKTLLKTVICIVLVIPLFNSVHTAKALENDVFKLIETLNVNEPLPQESIYTLNKVKTTDTKVIYSIPSHRFDYPFIIHTDLESHIIFIQLVIPENQAQTYLDSLESSLGKPENVIKNTETITLAEYPSKGITLHTDPQGESVYLVQKYLPTTPEIHRQEYGNGYKELTIPQYNQTEDNSVQSPLPYQKNQTKLVIVSSVIILFISLGLIVWLIIQQKRHRLLSVTPKIPPSAT